MSTTLRQRIEQLAPSIRAAADQIDRHRQLPAALLEALHAARLFRVLLPAHLGGEQPPLREWLEAMEQLAAIDASTAWCVNQGGVFATCAAWLDEPVAARLWQPAHSVIAHGPPTRTAVTRVDNGAYEVTGRWAYGSGVRHATLACGLAAVPGEASARLFIMPRDAIELIDTWEVCGLRGTGSFDFSADAVEVPAEHTIVWASDRPRDDWTGYRIPMMLLFACSFGAVALGAARHALDAAIELARSRQAANSAVAARDDTHVHDQLGHAEADWRAARALLYTSVDRVWEALADTARITTTQRVDLRIAGTHAMRSARAVAETAANVAGADVIRAGHPVHRPWQDTLAAAQHMQARTANYALLGRHLIDPQARNLGPMV